VTLRRVGRRDPTRVPCTDVRTGYKLGRASVRILESCNPKVPIMTPYAAFLPVALLTLASTGARPSSSDPIGIYALVDRVVLLPDERAPTQVEIWGAFAIARGYGDYCVAPTRGYLLFKAGKDRDADVAQWRELATLAASNTPVGFSSRHHQAGVDMRVCEPGSQRPEPVTYHADFGLSRTGRADYGPLRELRLLPKPVAPTPGGIVKVKPGRRYLDTKIQLAVENCLADNDKLHYVFTVVTNRGDRFASELIEPGGKTTTFETSLALDVGDVVTWSAQVVGSGAQRVPIATAQFTVAAE